MNTYVVHIELLLGGTLPTRATTGSAGYDVRACLERRRIRFFTESNEEGEMVVSASKPEGPSFTLLAGDRALVPLGFKLRLPPNVEAQLRPRSGNALKLDLTLCNSPGTVDSDFSDEVSAILVNRSAVPCVITDGQKIAQVIFTEVVHPEFVTAEVTQTTDRNGGFGSTDATGAA